MGFSLKSLYSIIRSYKWRKKINYLKENYSDKFKPLGVNTSTICKIIRGKNWEDRLSWILNEGSLYLNKGLSNRDLERALTKKRWKDDIKRWESKKDLLQLTEFEDERISPLVEIYLAKLIFKDYDRKIVSYLIKKCNYENMCKFIGDVSSISTLEKKAKSVSEIIQTIKEKLGYTTEEIDMYLIGLNRNKSSLIKMYNQDLRYEIGKTVISLNEKAGRYHIELEKRLKKVDAYPQDIDSTINFLLQRIKEKGNIQSKIFEKVIREYECDLSRLEGEELKIYQSALNDIRKDKKLVAEIYELILRRNNSLYESI